MANDYFPCRRRERAFRALLVSAAALALGGAAAAGTEVPAQASGKPRGHDVSSHQKKVDWEKAKADGARFVYVKATESLGYKNPYFRQQYDGSYKAGLIRGAYHFALPDRSSGKRQAAYFVRNGGGWSADGRTLPPALDMEHNPYGGRTCYGLGKARMVRWVESFSDEVKRRTGRRPVIYTSAHWWDRCTGGHRGLGRDHALWLARYAATPGPMPAGWSFATFWQYSDSGRLPGDQDLFNGSMDRLRRLAKG